jgi:hypothetical protein
VDQETDVEIRLGGHSPRRGRCGLARHGFTLRRRIARDRPFPVIQENRSIRLHRGLVAPPLRRCGSNVRARLPDGETIRPDAKIPARSSRMPSWCRDAEIVEYLASGGCGTAIGREIVEIIRKHSAGLGTPGDYQTEQAGENTSHWTRAFAEIETRHIIAQTYYTTSAELLARPKAARLHGIGSTHCMREGPGSNGSPKYWVSRATFPP